MKIALIILIILIILVLAISYFSYRMAFYMPKRPDDEVYRLPPGMTDANMGQAIEKSMKEMLARPFEAVTITGHDGRKLYGRYYHTADGAPVQILFHGYKSSAYIDCSGGTYLALKLGHNALVVDQRSHGKSEGNTITFGILERRDCLCWTNYICERFGMDIPIILTGLSMGAATVLMAADLSLPSNVKGIFADCPYSSPKAIIQEVCSSIKLVPALIYPFIRLGAFLFGHFNLEECSALSAVQNAVVPILLIHGENDNFVPCQMSYDIQKNCKAPVTLVTFPGAGHGRSYLTNPKHYEETVNEFVKNIL